MKICTIIGARPQFIKAAAVSRAFAGDNSVEEVIIHTGQHYDEAMSRIFFNELNIPREKYNLEVGSGSHGAQTGKMLEKLEEVLQTECPDWTLLYGDTNSTIAGALAAVKLHIPVVHIEAGMRSFNRSMPEEINRIVVDHIAELNLCSTDTAMKNLAKEGREYSAVLIGDVMYDCSLIFAGLAGNYYNPMEKFTVSRGKYILMTCHRAENTDSRERLTAIVNAVNELADTTPILYPVHPRTTMFLEKYELEFSKKVITIPPVSYFEMLLLEQNAKLILTDSGGVQKEAFFYRVPCVTMRDETEWIETVETGWNTITGAHSDTIINAVAGLLKTPPASTSIQPYGSGNAAEKILAELKQRFNSRETHR